MLRTASRSGCAAPARETRSPTLKLAHPLVRALGSDPFATEAARAAVRLAHLRRIRVVAVGVETAAHLDTLRALECDEAQGFLLGAPLAAEMFATGSNASASARP